MKYYLVVDFSYLNGTSCKLAPAVRGVKSKLILILFIHIITFISCGTHGRIKGYEFSTSKKNVNSAIKSFYFIYPSFQIPASDRQKLWHYEPYSSDSNKVSAYARIANSDSVSFYFYDKITGNLYWTLFENHSDDWMRNNCTLGLISVFVPNEIEKFEADLSSDQRDNLLKDFENRIMSKIDSILVTKK